MSLHDEFTKFLLDTRALKFGDFTLKSGRKSPYFINAGSFNDGQLISRLGKFYASAILQAQEDGIIGEFDTVFGPAYKGIPLAVATSQALSELTGRSVGYTFDRKEVKDHGDGGMFVGTQLVDGMRVLLVDDVMTAGTAVREVVPKIKAAADVQVAGLVLSVDRMEKTKDSDKSAVQDVQEEFGFPVIAIAQIAQIIEAARMMHDEDGSLLIDEELSNRIEAYFAQYGA